MKLQLVLFCLLAVCASAQNSPFIDIIQIGATVYDSSKNTVVPVITPVGSGSGVFIGKHFKDNSSASFVFLVTACHVVTTQDKDGFTQLLDNIIVRHQKISGGVVDIKYSVIYADTSDDLAILQRADYSVSFQDLNRRQADISQILPDSLLKVGTMTWALGYPLGIGIQDANPVMQSGIISYVDRKNHICYVDIPINYGNSGGPVYIIDKDGCGKLIGLVFQFQPTNIKQRIGSPVMTNSGLGRVLSGEVIDGHFRKMLKAVDDSESK